MNGVGEMKWMLAAGLYSSASFAERTGWLASQPSRSSSTRTPKEWY
jgi:hypothetical protein